MKYILFSFLLIIQSTYAEGKKIDCEKIRKKEKYKLIYQVKPGEDRTDVRGDEALWKSFQIKVLEKIPIVKKFYKKKVALRHLSDDEKEEILKCFHGEDFKISRIEGNNLEEEIPLLDEKDAEKLQEIYTSMLEDEKNLSPRSREKIILALKNIDNMNQNSDGESGLECLEDIHGIESKTNPINKEGMVQMFQKMICSTGIVPKLGTPHEWHKDFPKIGPKPPFSKLLVALANGDTNRIMPTGKENELGDWILKQETRSITIHQMFEQAYRINDGDMYSALLTVENVLSKNFYFEGNKRERLTITTKLSKIINHVGGEFDLYGPWYHLYGMILYGYVEENSAKASLMGGIEVFNSLFAKEYTRKQENYMIQGGGIGVVLKRIIKEMSSPDKYATICLDKKNDIQVTDYLNIENEISPKTNVERKIKKKLKKKDK